MANTNDVVKLALDTLHGNVKGDFSKAEASDTLQQALIEANGGSTVVSPKTFYRGSALYTIVEELMPLLVNEGLTGSEPFMNLVDYRNIAEGDEDRFWTEDKAEFIVSNIADGTTSIKRQRLNAGQYVTIDTQMRAIKVFEELNRLMSGRVDFQKFVDRVSTSFSHQMRQDILAVLEGVTTTTAGLNEKYVYTGTLDLAKLRGIIADTEEANNQNATIYGTKVGLAKIIDNSTTGVALASEQEKSDIYNMGYTGKFFGTPMVAIPNVHKVGTDDPAINDNKLYIVASQDKPIKFVNRGDGLLLQNDAINNADLTQEYLYGQAYGVGAIFNAKMGLYTMA